MLFWRYHGEQENSKNEMLEILPVIQYIKPFHFDFWNDICLDMEVDLLLFLQDLEEAAVLESGGKSSETPDPEQDTPPKTAARRSLVSTGIIEGIG